MVTKSSGRERGAREGEDPRGSVRISTRRKDDFTYLQHVREKGEYKLPLCPPGKKVTGLTATPRRGLGMWEGRTGDHF